MNIVVYGCFLTGAGLGQVLRENCTMGRTLAATLVGSLLFYVWTNFAVWLGPPMPPPFDYPLTFAGLGKCYVMALPFFPNALAGDVCWTLGLFVLFDVVRLWKMRRSTAFNRSMAA